MSGEYKNVVGYSPSDFFFVSALDSSQDFKIDCGNIDIYKEDEKLAQIHRDVCQNRDLVNTWTNQKINHSGSEQALKDSQTTFNATMLNTVNLLVGIGFLSWTLTNGWMYR